MEEIKSINGDWIFIAAIEGLNLSNTQGNEFQINRVTFLTAKRLARVRRRFGFKNPISHYYKGNRKRISEFLHGATALAVCRVNGKGDDLESKCTEIIRSELAFISLAQLGWSRRKSHADPRMSRSGGVGSVAFWSMEQGSENGLLQYRKSGRVGELSLDERWRKYNSDTFYFPLLQIVRGKGSITSSWRNNIISAAKLMGKSQATRDPGTAFLWNMIAIETLLTNSDGKYSVELPNRVFAFIGWSDDWEHGNLSEKLTEAYKLRCRIVHSGAFDDVTISDVLFSDDIAINVLENVVKHQQFPASVNALEYQQVALF